LVHHFCPRLLHLFEQQPGDSQLNLIQRRKKFKLCKNFTFLLITGVLRQVVGCHGERGVECITILLPIQGQGLVVVLDLRPRLTLSDVVLSVFNGRHQGADVIFAIFSTGHLDD
jgi:hypothetical protein